MTDNSVDREHTCGYPTTREGGRCQYPADRPWMRCPDHPRTIDERLE